MRRLKLLNASSDPKPHLRFDPHFDGKMTERLKRQFQHRAIETEHLFVEPDRWLRLTSFQSPYHSSLEELAILMQNADFFARLLSGQRHVYFGIGDGDTEAFLVKAALERCSQVGVFAVDVQRLYLEMFFHALCNLKKRLAGRPRIFFQAYQNLFQELSQEHFKSAVLADSDLAAIILGTTIGNFENPAEIISIFRKINSDFIILGTHNKKDMQTLDLIFSLYKNNPLFAEIFLEAYRRAGGKGKTIRWQLEKSDSSVRAYIDDCRVFYSRKYSADELAAEFAKFGYKLVETFDGSLSMVCVFERIK